MGPRPSSGLAAAPPAAVPRGSALRRAGPGTAGSGRAREAGRRVPAPPTEAKRPFRDVAAAQMAFDKWGEKTDGSQARIGEHRRWVDCPMIHWSSFSCHVVMYGCTTHLTKQKKIACAYTRARKGRTDSQAQPIMLFLYICLGLL